MTAESHYHPPEITSPPPEHWGGLSALRAIAMLLGITLHAAVPYMHTPMEGLLWGVKGSPSLICEIAFWWVHAWRLPLFFFLAGFFAKLTMDRYGAQQFASKRFKRIAVPYFAAIFTIGPAIYFVFAISWYLTGQCTSEQIWPQVPLPQKYQEHLFGPAHLWFLLDLMIMTCVYAGISFVLPINRSAVRGNEDYRAVSIWFPVFAAIPTGYLLWGDLSPVLAHHNTFLIDPPRLLYFCVYFIGGIVAYQHRDRFMAAARYPRIHLALAVPFSALFLILIRNETLDLTSPTGRLVMGATTALTAWFMIYGLMGCFLHHWKTEHGAVRYLADSSYWIYLCHLPIVTALHLALHWVQIPSTFKFVIVSVVTTIVGLLSYQFFVRHTILGQYLHGPRYPRETGGPRVAKPLTAMPIPFIRKHDIETPRHSATGEILATRTKTDRDPATTTR